ncbi:MAG: lamin tail domain-containing protein [Myxococcota bacterium]
MKLTKLAWIGLLALAVACGDDDGGGTDSGTDSGGGVDSGTDSGGGTDAGTDSGRDDSGPDDAGVDSAMDDAGTDAMMDDAGADAAMDDAGTDAMMMDAAVEDDGIAEVRAAAEGTHDPALEVRNVTVTFVRSAVDPDPAGFFVQAEMMGPAVFVAIDPTTITPEPTVGDVVDFDVTETSVSGDQTRVTALDAYTRDSMGADVSALAQDLSAADDIVSALANYESELVSFTGTLAGFADGAGGEYLGMRLVTAGMDDEDFILRAEEALYLSENLRAGCMVSVGPSPLWRFRDTAQAQVYTAADLTVEGACDPVTGANPPEGGVVITEIFYDFDDGAGDTSDDDREWVEVWNPSTTDTYNLRGCEIYDASNMGTIIDDVEIAPGAYVVVGGVDSETSPLSTLPFALNNGGDTIGIRCGGTTVDEVIFDESMGWADADSVSLQLSRGLNATTNDAPASWCLPDPTDTYGTAGQGGTPGAENIACPTTIVFSEYIEGSSNNKGLEVSVIVGAPINLSGCEIRRYNNGATDPTATFTFADAVLAAGEAYTVCDSRADFAGSCDETNGITGFNGDDALELYCGGGLVDSIGQVGFDPGSAWDVGGVSTQNATLRRTCTPSMGDIDSSDAFDPSVEWDAFDEDEAGDLGTYFCP